MQTTTLTTILFNFPEDQELHNEFIRSHDMRFWSKFGGDNRVTYAKVEQEETHDTHRIRG